MREPLSFFVAGLPKPAGSKRGFYIAKIKRVVITDACKGSKDWKTDVRHAVQAVYQGEPWDCPIKLSIAFVMPRPKGHFRTGKNSGKLRESAPCTPIVKPDLLKLARAVEDALTGVLYRDDSLIVDEYLSKSYGLCPGARIELTESL